MSLAVTLAALILSPASGTVVVPDRAPREPMNVALASWYNDTGATASGLHYTYGFASLAFGSDWGRRITFCYRRCVDGRMDDHGPYVSGRLFDLNASLKDALGCPDLCSLRWRVWTPPRPLGARLRFR